MVSSASRGGLIPRFPRVCYSLTYRETSSRSCTLLSYSHGRASRAIPRWHTVYETASPRSRSCSLAIERVCTPCAKIESFAHLRHPCYTARNGEKKGRKKIRGQKERERERESKRATWGENERAMR